MTRKAIQISAISDSDGYDIVFALCNDGTIWVTFPGDPNNWNKLPEIPQE